MSEDVQDGDGIAEPERTLGAVSTYTVQRAWEECVVQGREVRVWEDVAILEIPQRAKRKSRTLIAQALREAGFTPEEEPILRVLDAQSAEEIPIKPKAPTPEPENFEIG